MLQKIKIIDAQTLQLVPVWAWVVGNFGIHKSYQGYGRFVPPGVDSWTISHVPSGAVATVDASRLHRDWLDLHFERIYSAKWNGVSPYDMPICELANVMTKLITDLRGPGLEEVAQHHANVLNDLYCQAKP